MSHNFPTSTLREGVMAHNNPLLVWDSDTSGIYSYIMPRRDASDLKSRARGHKVPEASDCTSTHVRPSWT